MSNKLDEKDSLGKRMKFYENLCVGEILMPLLPVCARLDGKKFSNWTRGLKKPYDERLANLMIETVKLLLEETDALIGYTQSDEITLVWNSDKFESNIYFSGRVAKMNSVLASRCSNFFNYLLPDFIPEKYEQGRKNPKAIATFDCRVFNVPVKYEACNVLIWREADCTRNSVSCAAQANFSHNELQGKSRSEMNEMLFSKGINWNDYPSFFKRGTYIQRKVFDTPYTIDEIEKLPEKHAARKNPNLVTTRRKIVVVDMPPMAKVINREEVVFDGLDPKTASIVENP